MGQRWRPLETLLALSERKVWMVWGDRKPVKRLHRPGIWAQTHDVWWAERRPGEDAPPPDCEGMGDWRRRPFGSTTADGGQ